MASDDNKSRKELIAELQKLRLEKDELEQKNRCAFRDKEYLRDFLQKAPLAYLSLNEQGRLVEVNDTCLEILGYSRQEILGEHFSELVHEEWKERFLDKLSLLKKHQTIHNAEFAILPKDGSPVNVSFHARISINGKKAHKLIHCVLLDITERTRLLERLGSKERFLSATLESIQDAINIIDTDLNICRVNQVMRQWALTDGPLEGRKCYEAYRGASRPCSPCSALRCLRSKTTEHDECSAPPGSPAQWVEVASHPMRHPESGQVEYVVEFVRDITERKRAEEALRKSEERFQWAMEASRDGLWDWDLVTDAVFYSPGYAAMLGYSRDEVPPFASFWKNHLHPEDREAALRANRECIENRRESFEIEFRMKAKDGTTRWILGRGMVVARDERGLATRMVGTHSDITERKRMERTLRQSEKYYRAVFETSGSAMFILEKDTTVSLVNSHFEKLTGYSRREVEGKKSWFDFVHPEDAAWMREYHAKRRQKARSAPRQYEFRFLDRAGNQRHGFLTVDVIPGADQGVVSFIDITDRKDMEEKLKEMSLFDSLTGLYNRAFFEGEMQRLSDKRFFPLTIIVCDINGLKLLNDTLGHSKGDELVRDTAWILKGCFRASDITSRIGGDEFAVLLPQSSEEVARERVKEIRQEIARYNEQSPGFGLSVSIGYAVEKDPDTEVNTVFKRADDAMYKEKLQQSYSSRNAMIQALIKTLEARDHITGGHAERLCDYATRLGRSMGLSGERLNDLQLLARFHDLGKVGISDSILFKRGPLSKEEFEEMKRHCEIGHRIALSTSDLAPIAEYILKHHEWWDGQGYPLGLSGEDIPLECRILSIVDAYDAITSERPYKSLRNHEEAIRELRRNAGSQFDPHLVERFVCIIQEEV